METVDESSVGSTFSESARKRRGVESDDDSYKGDTLNRRSDGKW